jgi:hypothetical protein
VSRPAPGAARSSRQWPLVVVVVGVLAGLVVAWLGTTTWRLGCVLVGLALLVGAVERLVLGEREAGLLQVRGKGFDVVVLAVLGLAVVTLALVVPPGR